MGVVTASQLLRERAVLLGLLCCCYPRSKSMVYRHRSAGHLWSVALWFRRQADRVPDAGEAQGRSGVRRLPRTYFALHAPTAASSGDSNGRAADRVGRGCTVTAVTGAACWKWGSSSQNRMTPRVEVASLDCIV